VTKPTIVRLFMAAVVAGVAGGILLTVALLVAFANNVFIMSGPDVVGLRSSTLGWSMIGLSIVGGLVMMGGLVAGLVSWIGALLNTAQLVDKTWFVLLLVLGLLSFGLVAMIAYVIGGPDGTRTREERVAAMTAATSVAVMPPK
jgi:hypothetical protein